MRFSLRAKIWCVYILIILIGFSLIATLGFEISKKQYLKDELHQLYKDANYLAASYKVNEGNISQSTLESMAYASSSEIWIMDMEGNIKLHSGNNDPPERILHFNASSGDGTYYRIGSFYDSFQEETLSVYVPLAQGIVPEGYVIIHFPLSEIEQMADSSLRLSYLALGVFAVLFLLFMILLHFILYLPITKERKMILEYSNGNLSFPNLINSHDELGDIAKGSQVLANQLNAGNKDQHRMLANISHDFRSPLTSIRGYLTAIQDGTIPPEMQGKYLDVVLGETERLTKLSNNLLSMTQLESGILLDKTSFDINDLIRTCLPTFEGRVLEKNLEFLVTFEEESQLVMADKARIEQVLYNLVDNAIKFSNSNSSIDIETSLHGDKVFVSVKDYGVGIAKTDLNKIWDRFYKTDSSRGKDKKGTGLGLSIVREIIQAHKENIDVISTPDVGTEFIFTLPTI